jgi:hypothetical protein
MIRRKIAPGCMLETLIFSSDFRPKKTDSNSHHTARYAKFGCDASFPMRPESLA